MLKHYVVHVTLIRTIYYGYLFSVLNYNIFGSIGKYLQYRKEKKIYITTLSCIA